MGKGKQDKVVSMPKTPENYFKSGRARKLPMHECLISEDWREAPIIFILLARRHVNGNISWASYLVDAYCLGIRETDYAFNEPEEDYREYRNDYMEDDPLISCSYTIIHNLIYGAINFADTYGFKPCKDFNVSRFLLKEQDDSHVKKMDIEFGFKGKPAYLASPRDEDLERIVSTLERTAGNGNFMIIDDQYDGEEPDEEEWEEDDENGLFQIGEMEDVISGKKEPDQFQAFVLLNALYEISFPGEVDSSVPLSELAQIGEELEDLLEDVIPDNPEYYPDSAKIAKQIIASMSEERTPEEGLALVDSAIEDHPNLFDLYQLRMSVADFLVAPPPTGLFDGFYKRFPGRPVSKILRCGELISMGQPEKAFDVLNRKRHMAEAFPENKGVFSGMEIFSFYAVMCRYYTAMDDLTAGRCMAACVIQYETAGNMAVALALTDLIRKMNGKIDAKEDAE